MKRSVVYYPLAGAVLFPLLDAVAGQKTGNHLSEYEKPYNFQALELGLIQANLTLQREYVGIPKDEAPLREVPSLYFDPKDWEASRARVDRTRSGQKKGAGELKKRLLALVGTCSIAMKVSFSALPSCLLKNGPLQ